MHWLVVGYDGSESADAAHDLQRAGLPYEAEDLIIRG
jgi:hypothetical protein